MCIRDRCPNTARASADAGSPDATRSRVSPDLPSDSPSSPDLCSSPSLSSSSVSREPDSSHSSMPGSTLPDRVLIGTPSKGVKPIEVSTPPPSRAAHTDDPPPRWARTRRNVPAGRPSSPAARWSAQAYDRPWKPYRRSPYLLRHSAGSAYVAATAGMPAWKAVSGHSTCGMPGSLRRAASTSASAGGTCRGARSANRRTAASTPSSTTVGARTASPPCTSRWPATAISHGGASRRKPSMVSSMADGSGACRSTYSSWSTSPSRTRSSRRLEDPALTVSATRDTVRAIPNPTGLNRAHEAAMLRPPHHL